MKSKSSSTGLLSVFVSISIIAILFAIAVPTLQNVKSNAQRTAAAAQASS